MSTVPLPALSNVYILKRQVHKLKSKERKETNIYDICVDLNDTKKNEIEREIKHT
jgi:hypothetical protein